MQKATSSYTSRIDCSSSCHKLLPDKMFHFYPHHQRPTFILSAKYPYCMTQNHLCFIFNTCSVDIKCLERCYTLPYFCANHPIDGCDLPVKCKDLQTFTNTHLKNHPRFILTPKVSLNSPKKKRNSILNRANAISSELNRDLYGQNECFSLFRSSGISYLPWYYWWNMHIFLKRSFMMY